MYKDILKNLNNGSIVTIFSRPCVGNTTLSLEIISYYLNKNSNSAILIITLWHLKDEILQRVHNKDTQSVRLCVIDSSDFSLDEIPNALKYFPTTTNNIFVLIDLFQLLSPENADKTNDIIKKCETLEKLKSDLKIHIFVNVMVTREGLLDVFNLDSKPDFEKLQQTKLNPLLRISDKIMLLHRICFNSQYMHRPCIITKNHTSKILIVEIFNKFGNIESKHKLKLLMNKKNQPTFH